MDWSGQELQKGCWIRTKVACLSARLSDDGQMKDDRDLEKTYPIQEFIDKLRRLADCLEQGEPFEIQIGGERLYVPVRATYNIEHEREDGAEEIEFQIKWSAE